MKRAFTLVEAIVVLAVVLIVATIFIPPHVFYRGPRHNARRSTCQSTLKQISLAVLQYAQDADEKFPSLRSLHGWQGAIAPYIKDRPKFSCPSDEIEENLTDYWFNARLSEVHQQANENPHLTFLLGDGYATDDPNVSIFELPLAWRKNEKSPLWRHLEGANFAFADGHVKWLKPERATTAKPQGNGYTFRPQ